MRVGKQDTNNKYFQGTKRKESKIKKKIFFSKKFEKYKQIQEKETPIKFLCKKKNYFKIYNKENHRKKNNEKQLISKEGRWTEEEHNLFIEGIVKYGTVWKNVKKLIKTRTSVQVRSHAQKFFLKMKTCKDNKLGIDFTANSIKSIKDMIDLIKQKNYDIKNALIYLNKTCEVFKKPKIIENNDIYINNIENMLQNVINKVNKNVNNDTNNNNINNVSDTNVENKGFDNINLNTNIEYNNNTNYFKNNYFNNNYDHLLLNSNNYNNNYILENLQNNIYYRNLLHNLGNNYININNYNLSFPNTNIINRGNYILNPFFINNIVNNENEALKCFFINNIINNRNDILNQNSFNNTYEILNKLFINNNINDEKYKGMVQLLNNNNINKKNEALLYNKSETINNSLKNYIYSRENDSNYYSNLQIKPSLLPNSSLLEINNNNNNQSLFDRLNRQNLLFSLSQNNNNLNLDNDNERNLNTFNNYFYSLENKNNINILSQNLLNYNNMIPNQLQKNSVQIQANNQFKSNENLTNFKISEYSNASQKVDGVENNKNSNKDIIKYNNNNEGNNN